MSNQILICCVLITTMLGISISAVVVVILGIMYNNQCPLQSYVELFISIFFSLVCFRILFSVGTRFTKFDDRLYSFCCSTMFKLSCITDLFYIFWFITGSIWVLRIYPPLGNSRTPSQHFYFFLNSASAARSNKSATVHLNGVYCNQVIWMFYYVYVMVPCGFFGAISLFGGFKRLVWSHWLNSESPLNPPGIQL